MSARPWPTAPLRRVVDYFWAGTDPRVYALVRIAVSIAALVNLIDLWPHRQMYFSDDGILSAEVVSAATKGKLYESVFYFVHTQSGVTAVFVCAALAIVALGLGFGTRVAAGLVWAWHISYSHRAFPILHGWDAILRSYTLLVFLSPGGRTWSVDRVLFPRETDAEDVPVYGLRLMQWQLFVLYTTTCWLKVADVFWRNGQVLTYFSMSQYSRTPDDLFLLHHEWISAFGTYLTLATEIALPWLLWFKRTRPLGILAGFGLHFTIAATAELGVFSTCMIPPYFAFLDRGDVDWLVSLARVRSANQLWLLLGLRGGAASDLAPEESRQTAKPPGEESAEI
jgi:hypothetical protein